MVKVKFCTPYYNEFNHDERGAIIPNPENTTSAEKSINELVRLSGCGHAIFTPGTLYKTETFAFTWQRCRGTLIAESRNALINLRRSNAIRQQLPEPFDFYITLDTDILFTMDHIDSLLRHDIPIAGAAYRDRMNRDAFVGGWFEATKGIVGPYVKNVSRGIQKVDWIGMGLCCIKREVFETMPYPWFDFLRVPYTDNGEKCALRTGEDIGFCLNAFWCGFEVFMDCDCVPEHHTAKRSITDNPKEGFT